MCYSVTNKLSGNILVKKLCLWHLCLFIPYGKWNWPFFTCLSEMLFPFSAIQNYTSTLYLTLPVLKQEEKCRAWNGSVIYPTSHPSSATDYKIKECTPHIRLQKLWNARIDKISVNLFKAGFKWSPNSMYFKQESDLVCSLAHII